MNAKKLPRGAPTFASPIFAKLGPKLSPPRGSGDAGCYLIRRPLLQQHLVHIACTSDHNAIESESINSTGRYIGEFEGPGEPAGDLISRNLARRREALQMQQGPSQGEGWLSGLQQKTFPLGPNPNATSVQVRGPVL